MAYGSTRTVALFWLNASETWTDVWRASAHNAPASLRYTDKAATTNVIDARNADEGASETGWHAHLFSESGVMDMFVLSGLFHLRLYAHSSRSRAGPTPKDVMRQYALLTGTAPLAPMFALGYHQVAGWMGEGGEEEYAVYVCGCAHVDTDDISLIATQCKWNYKSQRETEEVLAGFDKHDMPCDVVW
jgi:alpha 1,3-glucosidase